MFPLTFPSYSNTVFSGHKDKTNSSKDSTQFGRFVKVERHSRPLKTRVKKRHKVNSFSRQGNRFPNIVNLVLAGDEIPKEYIYDLARISHGGKEKKKKGLDINIWVENSAKLLSSYFKARIDSNSAGDIERLPKNPKLDIHEFREIPQKTSVDKTLNHFREIEKREGRNHAIGSADFAKVQVPDHTGGITIDFRTVLPVPIPAEQLYPISDKWKGRIWFYDVPKPYKRLRRHKQNLHLLYGFNSLLLSRPHTKETEELKNRAAARTMLACNEDTEDNHVSRENRKGQTLAKVKKLSRDAAFLKIHPLTLQKRHEQRRMAGFQDWSRYSSERLQNYGSDLPRQFLRSDLTEQRTGRFVADMYESTYRAEKQPIEALVKHSLGDINLRGESKGGWEHKHPSPKAQDDFDLDYQSMRKDTFGTLNF